MERVQKSQDIISVIISAYNSESTIRDTLHSLENQDFAQNMYEVIIVDDGSYTQATKEIVDEYIHRWKMNLYYIYQENRGVWIARNAWVDLSVWKILAFTDADCICDPDWLSVIYENISIQHHSIIGGYTYSNDTVIFPWKMAPALQFGITANLAIDFMIADSPLFDPALTGMFWDDTDFVLSLEAHAWTLLFSVPQMRVLHPPNILSIRRILMRAKWRQNEVYLYKKHREKVLASFSFIFRPLIFSRISWFAVLFFFGLVALILLGITFWIESIIFVFLSLFLLFYLYWYRFFVMYNPDNRGISGSERIRTFFSFLLIAPLFIYYRIVWAIRFHFFML